MLTVLAVLAALIVLSGFCFGLARTILFLGVVLGLLMAGLFVVVIAKFVYTIALLWIFCLLTKLLDSTKKRR